jgi:UDP-N-acetyl-2-amino-2-deoxyglucuronate dehydrogenase
VRSADSDRPRVRAGIIGCGRMGAKHLRVLNENPEIELVAACDVSPQRLDDIPRGFVPKGAFFESYEEMFERVVLDLVAVVTPPDGPCLTRDRGAPARNLGPV